MAELPPVTISMRSMRSFGIVLTSTRHGIVQDVGRDVPAAVDQDQRALGAETAKVEQVEAGDADAETRILLGEGAAQLRQIVQRFADIGVAALDDALAA